MILCEPHSKLVLKLFLRKTQTLDTKSKLNSEQANVSNLNKLSLNVQKCKYII